MRQWTDALAAVLAAQSYSPSGEPRPALAVTPWGFTGEWHDPRGLVYLRARWYNSSLGRFTQVDLWLGELARPATRHAYTHALNDPLRYVDPTGRAYDWPVGETWRPVWDPSVLYLRTAYGYIDVSHYNAARVQAADIFRGLDVGSTVVVQTRTKFNFGFRAEYDVPQVCSSEDRLSLALGIFQDSSVRSERWQAEFPAGLAPQERAKASSFANEDLPSDHLGFYSAATGKDLSDIVAALGGALPGQPGEKPHTIVGPLKTGDLEGKNYEFTPRVQDYGGWHNVPWPAELQLPTPIAAEAGIWSFKEAEDLWPWTR